MRRESSSPSCDCDLHICKECLTRLMAGFVLLIRNRSFHEHCAESTRTGFQTDNVTHRDSLRDCRIKRFDRARKNWPEQSRRIASGPGA